MSTRIPQIGPALAANPLVGALGAVRQQIASLGEDQHKLIAATVLAVPATSTASQMIYIAYDVAPTTPIEAHVLNGWIPPVGARVLCLTYPPRGVVVLGQSDDAQLMAGSGIGYGYLQSVLNGAPGGVLFLNNNGGGVESLPMRPAFSANISAVSTTSAAFVPLGGLSVTLPQSPSGWMTVALAARADGGNALGLASVVSFEVRDGTSGGTSLVGPFDQNGAVRFFVVAGRDDTVSRTLSFLCPVAASGNIFVQLMFRTTGGTATWQQSTLSVTPEF